MNNREAAIPDGRVLRVIDASYNRAREGLRVIDDAARLILADPSLTDRLKNVRHDLTQAVAPMLAAFGAINYRDAACDVGTSLSAPTELARKSLLQLVAANSARVSEALRSIEEFTKLIDPGAARKVEQIRYRFYDLERDVVRPLNPVATLQKIRLYVLITQALCRRPWQEVMRGAQAGGANYFQLREKNLESGQLLARAREFVAIARELGAVSIINDRVDVAVLSDADGVHLGQSDLSIIDARRLLPPGKIVGLSTHNVEQARQAQLEGADYIGIGPMFASSTKPRDFVAGVHTARQVVQAVAVPTVAIGGITPGNVQDVFAAGVTAVAVSAAVCGADDPKRAAEALTRLNEA